MKVYGEWMYRSTFSWPQNYLDVSGQLHAPTALTLGKGPQYPLDRRLVGLQSRSGELGEQKIFYLTGDSNSDLLVFKPVASCYTDYAVRTR
jgi:hypothetical protein